MLNSDMISACNQVQIMPSDDTYELEQYQHTDITNDEIPNSIDYGKKNYY